MKQKPWWDAGTVEALRKVATYHKPSSESEKKVAVSESLSLAVLQGLYSFMGITMDKIHECASKFVKLLGTKYVFTASLNRKLITIVLDFNKTDFRHASGLHYVDDISIENNPTRLVDSILDKTLTDELLEKSKKYSVALKPEIGSVKERVVELCYIEDYLDKSDNIKIYKTQKFDSDIKADYFIEASIYNRQSTVYFFIRKREENDNYVVVSFFKKKNAYQGGKMYWMKKEKKIDNNTIVLYQNPNFVDKKQTV